MKPLHVALVLALLLLGSIVALWRFVPSAPVAPAVSESPENVDESTAMPIETAGEVLEAPTSDEREQVALPADDDAELEPDDHDASVLPDMTAQPADDGPKSAVTGIVLDDRTREPLPEYWLRLRDATGRTEDVATDASGRFTTKAELALGTLDIRLHDAPGRRRDSSRVEREHPGNATAPLELSVLCGPTFTLAFDPPAIAESELTARMTSQGRDARSTPYVPVRRGSTRWVRLPPLFANLEQGATLEVRAEDGLWMGSAEVVRTQGVERGVVLVRGTVRGLVRGRVVDDAQQPIERAIVTLEFTGGAEQGSRRTERTEADGVFRFEYVPAGAATIAVEAFRFVPQLPRVVALTPGAETVEEIALARVPPAGSIRGRITSESGRFDGLVRMSLNATSQNESRSGGPARALVDWIDEGGRKIGVFTFPDLPAGGYRISGAVEAEWYTVTPEWEPRSVLATPPNDSVAFLLRDGGARADLVFKITASVTGEAVDGCWARIAIAPRSERTRELVSGDVAVANAPYTTKVAWCLVKDGYQPVAGDETAFAIESPCDDKRCRTAEIALRPGWGDEFEITSRATSKPVAGVKVFVDGREAGTSDARGRVLVTNATPPSDLRFEYEDWRIVGRVNVSRPARRISEGPNRVRMSAPAAKK